jgi:hypothetical protein
LQEDLLRIPGVEGAEVEGTGDQPAGLRIRIAAGADQSAVGTAIRRVLTEHGLGTDTRLPGEDLAAPEGPAQPPSVDADSEPAPAPEAATEAEGATAVAVLEDAEAEIIDLTEDEHSDADREPLDDEVDVDREDAPAPAEPPIARDTDAGDLAAVEPPPAPRDEPGYARMESVSVEEGRDGILVTVASSDGETVAQMASSSEGGLESAIVKATSRLALPEAPDPVIVEIEERRFEGVDIVMLVLDTDGRITAGSSVVVSGRPFAIGRAAWSALTS